MAFLIFLSGELKGRKFEISETKISIGRSSSNTLVLNEPSVSSHHAEITKDGDSFTLTDLESTNGTFINGEQITGSVPLSPKTTLHFGDIETIFDAPEIMKRNEGGAPSTTTGIYIKPGATIRQIPPDAAGTFTVRKNTKWLWMAITGAAILLALAAMGWFVFRLVTG